MLSDILIFIKESVDETKAEIISSAIYNGTDSATVNFNPVSGKVFLVKFDPEKDTPADILAAARTICADAVMAGG